MRGGAERIVDGGGQSWQDRPDESPCFTNGATGMILVDLGADMPVSKVHSYSRHFNDEHLDMHRCAVERYTLWGATGSRPEAVPSERTSGGWTRIARVDAGVVFGVEEEPDRPAQQARAAYFLFSNAPTIRRWVNHPS